MECYFAGKKKSGQLSRNQATVFLTPSSKEMGPSPKMAKLLSKGTT
jgi:hypothetical protein